MLLKSLIGILICCCTFFSDAATKYRFTPYPWEFWTYLGPSTFRGDVPSGLFLSDKKFGDIKFNNSNICLGAGIHYRFHKQFETKQAFSLLQFAGNDIWYDEPANRTRNLSFRTRAIEWSSLLIWSPIHWDVQRRNKGHHLYIGSGWALMWYSPQAELNGNFHKLRPLGTEGQGLLRGKEIYPKASLALPFAMGYRYKLNRKYVLGLEFQLRKSFGDYIDDVSGTYVDNTRLRTERGDVAADLADRNTSADLRQPGSGRGNPGANDNYGFGVITFSYFLGSR